MKHITLIISLVIFTQAAFAVDSVERREFIRKTLQYSNSEVNQDGSTTYENPRGPVMTKGMIRLDGSLRSLKSFCKVYGENEVLVSYTRVRQAEPVIKLIVNDEFQFIFETSGKQSAISSVTCR